MPKLPAALREPAEEAAQSSGDFQPLEPGPYIARLSKCEASPSRAGKPMWRLEFDTIQNLDGTKATGGRLFTNITLEEATAWKVGQFFAAFGAPTSTDTDELINGKVRLEVTKRVQDYAGSKAFGKEINDIDRLAPLQESDSGYEAWQKLSSRLTKISAPAPKKAAAPRAESASDISDDAGPGLIPASPDDMDF